MLTLANLQHIQKMQIISMTKKCDHHHNRHFRHYNFSMHRWRGDQSLPCSFVHNLQLLDINPGLDKSLFQTLLHLLSFIEIPGWINLYLKLYCTCNMVWKSRAGFIVISSITGPLAPCLKNNFLTSNLRIESFLWWFAIAGKLCGH